MLIAHLYFCYLWSDFFTEKVRFRSLDYNSKLLYYFPKKRK